MDWMIMLAQLLLSLSFLVAVHEMGHLFAAKYFGMRVEQFSIGFPPKLWSFQKGETEYAISAIPLGGYVKISGMIDESLDTEAMKLDPQPWEFRSKPAWQRLIVMLGGIFVNVVVGILIFIGITYIYGDNYILKDKINESGGFQVGPIGESIGIQNGDKIVKINGHDYDYFEDLGNPETLLSANGSYTVDRNGKMIEIAIPADFIQKFSTKGKLGSFVSPRFVPIVESTEKGTIAYKAGLQRGDVITQINGKPIKYFDEVVQGLAADSTTKNIAFQISRKGTLHSYKGTFGKARILGFNADLTQLRDFLKASESHVSYSFSQSIPLGTQKAFSTLVTQVKAFGMVITGKLSAKKSLSGPIGIMQAFGPVWDWSRFWQLTGLLSLVLAFMNLLPIPALDGGHVMFLTYEIVSRRKPSDKFLENAQKVGMVLLLSLMVFVFANDIIKLVNQLY